MKNLSTFVRTSGNQFIAGKKFFTTSIAVFGSLADGGNSIGTNGQVLVSTGTGVVWADSSSVSNETLHTVTTRGNTTTNSITVGGLRVDDTTLYVDAANNRVGIGTLTPLHKLQVEGGTFADYFQLDTSYSNGDVQGRFTWDPDNNTALLGLDGDLSLRVGQDDMWFVKNQTGATIAKGSVVYASGTLGSSGRILAGKMIADGTIPARYILGIAAEDIANGADGYVLTKGKIRQLNTSSFAEGAVLWVSPTVAGGLTATEPSAPNLKLPVAFVIKSDANGTLAVRVETGVKLTDASDVQITTVANKNILRYNSTNSRWENVPGNTGYIDEGVNLYFTEQRARNSISAGTGISYNSSTGVITNSAPDQTVVLTGAGTTSISGTYPNFTITSNDQFVGTVTSVGLSVPTGFSVSGSPVTSSGTLAIGFASGYSLPTTASQTNWDTAYNARIVSAAVSGTTTKTLTLTRGDSTTLTASWTDYDTAPVTSVNGLTGAVVLDTDDVAEGTSNLYFTTARARASVSAGTGITYNSTTGVITNSAPDQTVALTAGTGISTSGTYPNFTIANTAPDQTVAITGAGTTVVTGTYPNFTVTSNDQYNGTVTSVGVTGGTGISVSGSPITSSGTITVTNTAPDQVVGLTGGTGISVSGTYPNFTITNTSPSSGGTVTGSGTVNYVSKWGTTTGLVDSQIFDNGTGVGIGTTSPNGKVTIIGDNFDVRNSSGVFGSGYAVEVSTNATQPRVVLVDNGTYTGVFTSNSGLVQIKNDSNNGIAFNTNLSERMRITATGNVGIGTTAPTYKLDVVGEGRTSDAFMAGGAINIDNNLALQISSAGAGTQRWIGVNKNNGYGLIIGYNESAAALNGVGAYIRQVTSDPVHFLIDNTNTAISIVSGGNVGIGTTSPGAKLHIGENGAAAQLWLQRTDGYNPVKLIGGTLADGNGFKITMNTTDAFAITSGGNVGIGTTSPNYLLDLQTTSTSVTSNLKVNATAAANNYAEIAFQLWSGAGGGLNTFGGIGTSRPSAVIRALSEDAAARGALVFATFSGGADNSTLTEKMRITSAGNVGIGTTSPAQKLDVSGNLRVGVGASDDKIELMHGAGASDYGALRFYQAGVERQTIHSFSGAWQSGTIYSASSGAININGWYGVTFGVWYDPDAVINTAGPSYFKNNVLIGTTTDAGHKLDVNGTGRFSGNGFFGGATAFAGLNGGISVNGSSNSGINFRTGDVLRGYVYVASNNMYLESVSGSVVLAPASTPALTIASTGAARLNYYGSGTITGTPAYNLGVDSSGNVIELPGGVVDGSGTANKVSKWSDANTLTDANITDNGTTVRINSLPLMADSRVVIGTAGADQTYASVFIGGNLTEGSSQYALLLDPQLDGTTNYGMLANARIAANVTATTAYGIYQINNELLSGASVVNNYGIYIANQTSGTTQNWNLYSDTGKNYFGGNVLIGTTTDSGYKLNVNGTTNLSSTLRLVGNMTVGGDTSEWQLAGVANGGAIWQKSHSGAGGSDDRYLRFGNVDNNGTKNYVMTIFNSNVGIGTTSPNAPLHIIKDLGTGAEAVARLRGSNSTARTTRLQFEDYNGTIADGLIDFVIPTAGSSTGARLDIGVDSAIVSVVRGGNVGIGTTSPQDKLEIKSGFLRMYDPSANINAGYTLQWSSDNGGSNVTYAGIDGITTSAGARTGDLRFLTSSAGAPTEKMRITGAGNVGIGTTSPGAPLHVYKSDTYSAIISREDWNSGTSTKLALGKQYGVLGFISTDLVETTNDTSYIALNYKSGLSSYAEGLRVYNNGNVGIGTTSPSAKLHINPSTTNEIAIAINGTQNYSANTFQRISAGDGSSLNRVAIGFGYNSTPEWTIRYSSYHNHEFFTGNDWGSSTEKMRITSAGNVGIGTTSPSAKLQVYGDIASTYGGSNGYVALQAGASTVQGYVEWFKPGPTRVAYMGYNDGSTANNLAITLENSANFIVNGGNVGIGTASPSYKLDVQGNAGLITINTNGAISTGTQFITGSGILAASSSGTDVVIKAGASTLMTLKSGGNVLIGTTTDAGFKLDVNGTARLGALTGTSATFSSSVTANSVIIPSFETATNVLSFRSGIPDGTNVGIRAKAIGTANRDGLELLGYNGIDFSVNNGANVAMRIVGVSGSGLGNVGIGTTSPSQKLHVDGSARVTGAYYDSSNSSGTSGQVLSSTGSGTQWVAASAGSDAQNVLADNAQNKEATGFDFSGLTDEPVVVSGDTIRAYAPVDVDEDNFIIAIISFEVATYDYSDGKYAFNFHLDSPLGELNLSRKRWSQDMWSLPDDSKGYTTFTYHMALKYADGNTLGLGDAVTLKVSDSYGMAPLITFASLTLQKAYQYIP